jgi:hypothetical protein
MNILKKLYLAEFQLALSSLSSTTTTVIILRRRRRRKRRRRRQGEYRNIYFIETVEECGPRLT